ncbi:hypothetical protein EIP91_003761 [Steccherinum ochraceum]|uniref:F-box domain-containing protein n=1 Tax=Steccherinum ochraceum TaxID=92696 RepID=A0A4R0RLM2_9APHY|nr:hypothetical protein EIP91_003761 [Steccherinum ochraceum]
MHRIFSIQEIVDNIVQCLAVRDTFSKKQASDARHRLHPLSAEIEKEVRNLGQAGRAFRHSCLNELWYHQDGIMQLLFMISVIQLQALNRPKFIDRAFLNRHRFAASYIPHPSPWVWALTRSLQPEDVPGVLFYSSRIREMSFTDKTDRVWLCQLSLDGPLPSALVLFPQLRVFAWIRNTRLPHGMDMDFVLNRTGDKLTVMAGAIHHRQRIKFMDMIQERRDHLSYLSFEDWDNLDREAGTREVAAHFFRDVLPGAKSLRQLHLRTSFQRYFNVWDVISKIPCLDKLTLRLTGAAIGPTSPASYGTLTTVIISVCDARLLCSLLEQVRFTRLQELKLDFYDDMDLTLVTLVPVVRSLLRSAVAACANSPLTSFTITSSLYLSYYKYKEAISAHSDTALEGFGLRDLRPLMEKFPKLEVLDLRLGCHWILGDDDLKEIGRVWGPTLQVLRLDPDGGWFSSTCVTVRGLKRFASQCPRLSVLGIQFVESLAVDDIPTVHMLLDRNNRETLRIRYTHNASSASFKLMDIARYLLHCFPSLRDIEVQ